MSSTPQTGTPEDDDFIAAEYVLGALDLSDRSAAEDRLKRDPSFAALVNAWQNRLSGLNDDYAEAPAPNLLPQIEARLFPQPAPVRRRWFGALMGLAFSTIAALGLIAFFALQSPDPSMIAALTAESSALRFDASIAGTELTLIRSAGTIAEAGKDYELWIIEPDKAPVSLGVLTADRVTIAAPTAKPGYVLAITLEPKGGAPEGKPTGPVVAAGPLQNI